jgi:hypothetical protein
MKSALPRLIACMLFLFAACSTDAPSRPTQIASSQGSWSKKSPLPIQISENSVAAANAATSKPIRNLKPTIQKPAAGLRSHLCPMGAMFRRRSSGGEISISRGRHRVRRRQENERVAGL